MRGPALLPILALLGCASAPRYLHPAETAPSGAALGAQHRLIATHADGSKEYALILRDGDTCSWPCSTSPRASAPARRVFMRSAPFATRSSDGTTSGESNTNVRAFHEQAEVLSLTADIGVDEAGAPIIHAHCALGGKDGPAVGGHLVSASASPNIEVL
jgi:uncharacterized protein